jgi:hypothetical protein
MPDSVEQVFSSLGGDFQTGGPLSGCASTNSPCRKAYEDWAGAWNGRNSWDPLAVLVAVRGESQSHVKNDNVGWKMSVDEMGHEDFEYATGNNQSRVNYRDGSSSGSLKQEIDDLLCKDPGSGPVPPSGNGWVRAQGFNCYGSRGFG